MRRQRTFIGPQGMSGTVGLWGASSSIRSVQRGSISITNSATATATITAVNTANAVIRFSSFTNGGISQNDMIPMIELTNSTTVTASRFNTSANGTSVNFEVTEYAPGVIKSVQRLTGTFAAASPVNVTITAVGDLTKTSLEWLGWRYNDAAAPITYLQMTIALTSTTNVQGVTAGAANQQFSFQVTEWY